MPVIEVNNLGKRYGDRAALEGLSLTVESGCILGLIGPHGAGKTTALRLLAGLDRSSSGTARVAGYDCAADPLAVRRLVGYMPETFGGGERLRVREYLDFFAAAYAVAARQREPRLAWVLELTGSAWMADRFIDDLPHAMKQRLALARALVHDPPVLILDEPADGLDPHGRIEFRQLLLKLAGLGKTLIVSSRVLSELSQVCHQAAILMRGRLRALGSPTDIRRQVRQHRLLEAQLLDGAQVESAAALLRQHLEPEAAVIPVPQEAVVRFSTGLDDARLARLLQALAAGQVGLVQFREVPLELEDAFLEVTGPEEARDAHSTEGPPRS